MITIGTLLEGSRKAEPFLKARTTFPPYDSPLWKQLNLKQTPTLTSTRMCGIEVELENCDVLSNADSEHFATYDKRFITVAGIDISQFLNYCWHRETDGSLRNNGQEYITKLGTTFESASLYTQILEKFITSVERYATANARTGLHVHVDMRDLKLIDLQRLLLVYLAFEKAIFDYSGKRQGSLFCVPLYETMFPFEKLRSVVSSQELRDVLSKASKKYMGLNLLPLITQGTIEFRMHSGTYKSKEINSWLTIISDLVDSVTKRGKFDDYDELVSIITSMQKSGLVLDFAREVFPNSHALIIPHITDEGVELGVDRAKDLIMDVSKIPQEFLLETKRNMGMWELPEEVFGLPDDDDAAGRLFARQRNMRRGVIGDPAEEIEIPDPTGVAFRALNEDEKQRVRELIGTMSLASRWRDNGDNMLPSPEEVPPASRVQIDQAPSFWVHGETILNVFRMGQGLISINANSYIAAIDVFIEVVSHGHVRPANRGIQGQARGILDEMREGWQVFRPIDPPRREPEGFDVVVEDGRLNNNF